MTIYSAPELSSPRLSRRAYAALLTGQFGQGLTLSMLSAVLPQIAAYFGGGAGGEMIAQQMATFPFLGLTAGGLLSGPIIKRLGLRPTVLVAASLFAASGAVPIVTATALPMLVAAFVLGLCASLLTSAISGVAGEVLVGEPLAKLVGYQVALGIIGSGGLGFLAALASQSFGWRAPFAGYVITGTVILALNLAGLPNVPLRGGESGAAGSLIRAVWTIYLLGFLTFIVVTLVPTYMPFFMAERGIFSAATRSGLLTVVPVAVFLGSMVFPQIQGRLPAWAATALPTAFLSIAFLLLANWTGPVWQMALALTLAGLGIGLIIPSLFTSTLARAPHAGAQAIGFLNASIFAGSFVTPYLLSTPRQQLGIAGMLWGMCFAILAVGIIVLLVARRNDSVSEETTTSIAPAGRAL